MSPRVFTRYRPSRRWLNDLVVLLLAIATASAHSLSSGAQSRASTGNGAQSRAFTGNGAQSRAWRDPDRRDDGYDGRFRFVRLRWDSGLEFGRRGMSNAWNHDYPRAEQNLARILRELTLIDITLEGRVLRLDDPELFNHPIAYMWEPGFWVMTDEQGARFREYLLKGGFAIFDDFEYDQWNNLEAQMRRVLPEGRWVKLDASNRIFDAFFRMKDIEFPHPMYGIKPTYYGIYQDNDPAKRLLVIANHNHDVAEYWEFSDQGVWPIDLSNEAYKLGVNYFVYGLTH